MSFEVSLTAAQAWFFLPLALPMCIWAIYTDVKEFRISNYAVLGLIVAFLVIGPFAMPFGDYLWQFANFGIVLVIGFALWALTGLGAGDAKIAAAIALYVMPGDVMSVLLIWLVAMVGMMILYSRRAVEVAQADGLRAARKMAVPFGIALAPTLVIYLVLGITHGGF